MCAGEVPMGLGRVRRRSGRRMLQVLALDIARHRSGTGDEAAAFGPFDGWALLAARTQRGEDCSEQRGIRISAGDVTCRVVGYPVNEAARLSDVAKT